MLYIENIIGIGGVCCLFGYGLALFLTRNFFSEGFDIGKNIGDAAANKYRKAYEMELKRSNVLKNIQERETTAAYNRGFAQGMIFKGNDLYSDSDKPIDPEAYMDDYVARPGPLSFGTPFDPQIVERENEK